MVFPRRSAGERGQKTRQWAGKDGKAKALTAIVVMAWIAQPIHNWLILKVKKDTNKAAMLLHRQI